MIAGFRRRLSAPAEHTLDRLILWTAALLVVSAVGFGAFYYYDRQPPAAGPSPLDLAIGRAEEAARINPDDFDTRMALAAVYFVAERYLKSAEQYRAAATIDDKSIAAISGLGRALFEAGQLDEAAANFQEVVEAAETVDLAPELVGGAHYFLARIALGRNTPDEAITQAKAALVLDRSDADSWQVLGAAYVSAGNWDEAITALLRAIAFVPDFREAFDQLAVAYEQKGMTAEARYARGMQAYSEGDYDRAAKDLEAAISATASFANARLGLAMTREKQGKKDVAVVLYRETLQLDPNNFMARNALARLGKPWQDVAAEPASAATGLGAGHAPLAQPTETR